LGTVGIALSFARENLNLNALWLGLLGGASLAGLFVGSLFVGPLADRFGRRPMFLPTMAIFALVSLTQFFVTAAWQLLCLRLLLGVVLGVDYVVCSTLVAEFAPRRVRGRLLSILVFTWSIGYTAAFVVGNLVAGHFDQPWRWILLSSAIPATLIFFIRLTIPESPSWLVQQGRATEAAQIIARYLGPNVQPPIVTRAAPAQRGSRWRELWSRQYRRRTVVGAVFYTAQVIPYFAMSTFIPSVFAALGIRDAYTGGIVFNVFLMLGSGCGIWLIDRLTRRQFLIGSFYITAAALLFLTIVRTDTPWVVVGVFALFAFVLAAATNLEFAYLPELFPSRLRASGVGVGTAASRLGSALSTFFLPMSVEAAGIRPTLGLCVGVLALGGVVCQLLAPETQERSIEEAWERIGE
jgi:putative MFS transporter